jgi:hypothetical protein
MENLDIWKRVCTPPQTALKKIEAGDLKGYSDISPMWRIQILTEVFGPCGKGWYYEITNKWQEKGVSDSVMCFVDLNLFVKYDNEWSKPIQGSGGSMLINKFSKGLKNSDEGYKMALTDALSVCMKSLGVAAQVYSGFDSSKYMSAFEVNKVTKEEAEKYLRSCSTILELKDTWNKYGTKFPELVQVKDEMKDTLTEKGEK